MKTPEEIKKGLECARNCEENDLRCRECPYLGSDCSDLHPDALAYIQQLETERHQLLTKCERLERERDAAIKDLSNGLRCNACKKFFKNNKNVGCSGGLYCIPFRFEWRGVCPENMEVKEDE